MDLLALRCFMKELEYKNKKPLAITISKSKTQTITKYVFFKEKNLMKILYLLKYFLVTVSDIQIINSFNFAMVVSSNFDMQQYFLGAYRSVENLSSCVTASIKSSTLAWKVCLYH